MSAIERTKNVLRLSECPVELLVKNELNPNKMSTRQFDLLVDNLTKTGMTDPILACPADRPAFMKAFKKLKDKSEPQIIKMMIENALQFRIVGGHHRYDGAMYLQFPTVPVNVITDEEFDADAEVFQIVRMNVIHGKMDASGFVNLMSKLSGKYADDVLQEAFGFSDEAEFKKLVNQFAKALPDKATQDKFKEAAKEIKTIDDLAVLLNSMMSRYGNTLPYGYMFLDYGGKDSVWLRIEQPTLKAVRDIGSICIENSRTIDDVLGRLVQLIAKGECKELLAKLIATSEPVTLPADLQGLPTKETLTAAGAHL